MNFRSHAEVAFEEMDSRQGLFKKLLSFGVKYLDDAMYGILPHDLILIGAPSGAGKTQFCTNLALRNVEAGKRVHYIALEADDLEIDRRIKYQILAQKYFADPERPLLDEGLSYPNWFLGVYGDKLWKYESEASAEGIEKYQKLFTYYKISKFGLQELIELVLQCAKETDLIIVDHVHYFDFDEDETENQAIKKIAKIARTLALEQGKPIILVSHLRKRDRFSQDLVPGLEEFHGSSDLFKIATKAITFAPGGVSTDGTFETFFRIGKNRLDGGVTRFLGRVHFTPQRGHYEQNYKLGWAEQKRREPTSDNPSLFTELDHSHYPQWARTMRPSSSHYNNAFKTIPNIASELFRSKKPYADV